MDRSKCESCGREWVNHPGITLTCAENKHLKTTLKIIKTLIDNDDLYLQDLVRDIKIICEKGLK